MDIDEFVTVRIYLRNLADLKKRLEFHRSQVLPLNCAVLNLLLVVAFINPFPCTASPSCTPYMFFLHLSTFNTGFFSILFSRAYAFLVQPRVSLSFSERLVERLSSVCIATTDYSRVDRYTNGGVQAYSRTRPENLKIPERRQTSYIYSTAPRFFNHFFFYFNIIFVMMIVFN